MEFGTRLIGIGQGVRREFMFVNGDYQYLYFYPIFKFIFERPDNQMFVVERDEMLFQESKDLLLPLNDKNMELVKGKIEDYYKATLSDTLEKHRLILIQQDKENQKVEELKMQVAHLESINETNFTENRASTIRQVSKSIRKHTRRLESVSKKRGENSKKIKEIRKELKVSIDYLEVCEKNDTH